MIKRDERLCYAKDRWSRSFRMYPTCSSSIFFSFFDCSFYFFIAFFFLVTFSLSQLPLLHSLFLESLASVSQPISPIFLHLVLKMEFRYSVMSKVPSPWPRIVGGRCSVKSLSFFLYFFD